MSRRQTREQLLVRDEIVAAPPKRACEDQNFELPAAIYIAMVMMFAGFVAVLSLAFRGGHLPVVYGVIFAFIAAFFAIPAMFPAMVPRDSHRTGALSLFDFGHRGIMTATGRASAREATVLVLLLPCLILCFGISVAIIASLA
jgi:cytochrome bd-type quinol oxidase subunit 2